MYSYGHYSLSRITLSLMDKKSDQNRKNVSYPKLAPGKIHSVDLYIRVFHDKQIWQKICEINKSCKMNSAKKQLPPVGIELPTSTITGLKPMRPHRQVLNVVQIFQMNYSHTLLIPELSKVQKVK